MFKLILNVYFMQPGSLVEKGMRCFKSIKRRYSSTSEYESDEESDTDLVSS